MQLFNDPKPTNYHELVAAYPELVAHIHTNLIDRHMWHSDEAFMDFINQALTTDRPRTEVVEIIQLALKAARILPV